MRKKLILVVSKKMNSVGKERNESNLIRMTANTRQHMGYSNDKVEVWLSSSTQERIASTLLLDINRAYKDDIKKLNELVADGKLLPEDIVRVGFVTEDIYQTIVGKNKAVDSNIWISDRIEDTVIGADPEFMLFDKNGKVVRADKIVGFTKIGNLGHDGAIAELRPNPAMTPMELASNIHKILSDKNLTSSIEQYDWRGMCYFKDQDRDYTVGGHIHIGSPIQIAKLPPDKREAFFKVLNKILDELLAIPMTRLDGQNGKIRRTTGIFGKYGYFGEMRQCNGRLEHRTLSGMWLCHPEITKMVIGTAKLIIDEVFRLISEKKFNINYMSVPDKYKSINVFTSDFDGWKDIELARDMGCIRQSSVMRSLLNEAEPQKVNKDFLTKWYATLKTFSSYRENSIFLDGLFELLKIPLKNLKGVETNLKKTWLEGKPIFIK